MARLALLPLVLLLVVAWPPPAGAQRPFNLESNVRLLGASRNNTRYLVTITPGADPVVPLAFRVDMAPEETGKAELQLTPFDSEGAPPIAFTLMEPTADNPVPTAARSTSSCSRARSTSTCACSGSARGRPTRRR